MLVILQNKKVLLAVTGGIAVYKACDLTSKLTQAGADVRVIMTESACEFVSPLTFQALSRNPVYTDTFDEKDPKKIAHIDLADWAEIVIIAPATANSLSKIANGLGDDMLTTTLLATRATIYVAPAMNVHMYQNQAVIENMQKLTRFGYNFIEPGAGYLACGYVGKGRLEEPKTIIDVITKHESDKDLLNGKKVLITAGPTREEVDPVRFFSNRSTGKMGFALAEVAARLGAEVTLVSGPVNLKIKNEHIKQIKVITAEDMYQAVHEHFHDADIVIKAAAVADYRPKETHTEKMKKSDEALTFEMERTKDILKSLGEIKENQFLIGFAAETENHLANGKEKLIKKNLDAIIINNVSEEGAGFASDTNIVTYLDKDLVEQSFSLATKETIAEQIYEQVIKAIKDKHK